MAAGDVLGKATGESVFVVIRSKIFDSYLVSMAQVMPYRHHECWYFYPGMLDAVAMDWLSYAPFSKFCAEWNYLKITRLQKERDFQYKTLVYTSLLEYPVTAADGTSRQSLVHEGAPSTCTGRRIPASIWRQNTSWVPPSTCTCWSPASMMLSTSARCGTTPWSPPTKL